MARSIRVQISRNFVKTAELGSFTAPHHPATNGAAENFVETFKNKVDKIVKSRKSLECAVNLFLFDYRATEIALPVEVQRI